MGNLLTDRDKKVIWHPFTPQKYMATPIPVAKAEGIYLTDTDGKQYMDVISSWWVNLHGHSHPYIAEKLYKQALTLEQVIFAGFTHEPAVSLAERLLELLPGQLSRIFYSDNGSTSTEVALKMSIQYWWNNGQQQRNKILALKNAYHGDTFGAMSVSDRSVFTLAFHDKLFEVIFIDAPTLTQPDDVYQHIPWHEIACFIYEPLVQGAGGMTMYDKKALDSLLKQCHEQGIICIADEVMTGFGRTGQLFASSYMQEKPDIICLSKGLTGGTMPLGVTACNARIYEAFVTDDKLKTFFHGHSFTANPLACTVANASLDLLLRDECQQSIANISQQHIQFAAELNNRYNEVIKSVRCLGTILAFEIAQGKDEYLNAISSVVTDKALQKGIYLRPLGNTVYLMPPYCVTTEQLQKTFTIIEEIIKEIT